MEGRAAPPTPAGLLLPPLPVDGGGVKLKENIGGGCADAGVLGGGGGGGWKVMAGEGGYGTVAVANIFVAQTIRSSRFRPTSGCGCRRKSRVTKSLLSHELDFGHKLDTDVLKFEEGGCQVKTARRSRLAEGRVRCIACRSPARQRV